MARNPSLSQQKATRRCVIASLRRKIACLQRKFVELEQNWPPWRRTTATGTEIPRKLWTITKIMMTSFKSLWICWWSRESRFWWLRLCSGKLRRLCLGLPCNSSMMRLGLRDLSMTVSMFFLYITVYVHISFFTYYMLALDVHSFCVSVYIFAPSAGC